VAAGDLAWRSRGCPRAREPLAWNIIAKTNWCSRLLAGNLAAAAAASLTSSSVTKCIANKSEKSSIVGLLSAGNLAAVSLARWLDETCGCVTVASDNARWSEKVISFHVLYAAGGGSLVVDEDGESWIVWALPTVVSGLSASRFLIASSFLASSSIFVSTSICKRRFYRVFPMTHIADLEEQSEYYAVCVRLRICCKKGEIR
jgi:hypothetical protein